MFNTDSSGLLIALLVVWPNKKHIFLLAFKTCIFLRFSLFNKILDLKKVICKLVAFKQYKNYLVVIEIIKKSFSFHIFL